MCCSLAKFGGGPHLKLTLDDVDDDVAIIVAKPNKSCLQYSGNYRDLYLLLVSYRYAALLVFPPPPQGSGPGDKDLFFHCDRSEWISLVDICAIFLENVM